MGVIRRIKNLAKKSQTILRWHKQLRFFKRIPLKDYFNFRKLALVKKVHPYTMVNYPRINNAYELTKLIEERKLKGALVECGVWKGGCIALMAFIAKQAKSNRKVWLFDSLQGCPEPTEKDGTDKDGTPATERTGTPALGRLVATKMAVGSREDVEKIFFATLKIDRKNVIIREGWFQETLPVARKEIGSIAVLRIDADWYESTKYCLENLYDNVVSGGYIVIDDYNYWEGCTKAVNEFLQKRNLRVNLFTLDGKTGAYFQKS